MSENSQSADQLLTYYRQRASDLEFQFLQFQVEATERIKQLESEVAVLKADEAEESDV